MDAVFSMHTVYHNPLKEKTNAVEETFKVIKAQKTGCNSVFIVYSLNKPLLMQLAYKVRIAVLGTYKMLVRKPNKSRKTQTDTPQELFLYNNIITNGFSNKLSSSLMEN